MMSRVYRFDGSKALVEKEKEGFVAKCKCGWSSKKKSSREGAVIDFETHVRSDPKHNISEEKSGVNLFSLFLAFLGFLYVVNLWDFDFVYVVGWIDDLIVLILSVILVKGGLDGKSPIEIIKSIFE